MHTGFGSKRVIGILEWTHLGTIRRTTRKETRYQMDTVEWTHLGTIPGSS